MKSIPLMLLLWYLFPVILLFACNYIVSTLSLKEKYKIKAPDLAVPFLFIGIGEISKASFHYSIVPITLLVSMIIGIIVVLFHGKHFGDIQYRRFFKMFWRIIFLYVMILYIGLTIASIAKLLF